MSKKKAAISVSDKRKPPAQVAAAGDRARFVSGGGAETSRRDREKLTVYIDREVLTALRVHCARERKELSDVTTVALAQLLGV